MKQRKRLFAAAVGIAAGAAWIGVQQPASSLLPPASGTEPRGSRPLPAGLPAPVRTYLAGALGDAVPIMETAIAWGTARLRLGPLWTSSRWRAYTVPGRDFYRTLEIKWFGRTLLTGYDAYVDADGVKALGPPLNLFETGPAVSQGENMMLWAEAPWAPSVLAGERAQWHPIDATAAYLRYPAAAGAGVLRAAFDPGSGRLREMTGERARHGKQKRSWRSRYSQWQPVTGLGRPVSIPHRLVLQWADQGQPYADILLDGIVYNVDVSQKIPVST